MCRFWVNPRRKGSVTDESYDARCLRHLEDPFIEEPSKQDTDVEWSLWKTQWENHSVAPE